MLHHSYFSERKDSHSNTLLIRLEPPEDILFPTVQRMLLLPLLGLLSSAYHYHLAMQNCCQYLAQAQSIKDPLTMQILAQEFYIGIFVSFYISHLHH